MNWRFFRVAGLLGVVLIALIALLLVRKPFSDKMVVKAYFSDAMSLLERAVRLAGVDIDSLKECARSTRTERSPCGSCHGAHPFIRTEDPETTQLRRWQPAGVLGETYVQIGTRLVYQACHLR